MRRLILTLLLCASVGQTPGGGPHQGHHLAARRERDNQLIGYGLVVGLQGTGDTLRNVPFTEQAIQAMLDRMGAQRARQRLAQPQRRGGDRDRGPAVRRGRRLAARRHRFGARRRALADGRHAAADAIVGDRRRGLCERARRGVGHRLRRRRPGADAVARACRRRDGFPTARSSKETCRRRPTSCG